MALNLTIKQTNGTKFQVQADSELTIFDIKCMIEEEAGTTPECMKIIYKGRILKDEQSLEECGVASEETLILVKKRAKRKSASTSAATTAPTTSANPEPAAPVAPSQSSTASQPSNPTGANPLMGMGNLQALFGGANQGQASANPFAGLGAMMGGGGGGGGGGMPNMQQMQQQMMQNPELMRQMMDSPLMQGMMNNPDILRNMFEANPQLRRLLDQNPQLRHVLNDPATMRRAMEMARNPALYQEMLRNQDRAMAHIEAMPGGFNALSSAYSNVQAPMERALQNAFGSNEQTETNVPDAEQIQAQGVQTNAMPNPFNSSNSGSQSNAAAAPPPGIAQLLSGLSNQTNQSSSNSSSNTSAAANPMAGLMGMGGANPAAMMQNPQQMQQMMQNPMVQGMMRNLSQNPQMMQQMLQNNPMLQQMAQQNPQMGAMLNNPQLMSAMMNPDVMNAAMQMRQSMNPSSATNAQAPPTSTSSGASTGAAQPASNAAAQNPFLQMMMGGAPPSGANPGAFNLGNLFNAMPQQPAAAAPVGNPEEVYAVQLTTLQGMGFTDRAANIQALVATGGNIEAAVTRLLG